MIYIKMMAAPGLNMNQIAVFAHKAPGKTEKIKAFRCVEQGVFSKTGAGWKFLLLIQRLILLKYSVRCFSRELKTAE